jgi:hypothetical protein
MARQQAVIVGEEHCGGEDRELTTVRKTMLFTPGRRAGAVRSPDGGTGVHHGDRARAQPHHLCFVFPSIFTWIISKQWP